MGTENMIRLIESSAIPEGGSHLVVTEEGDEIVLFKVQGEIFALANACPHEGGPLCEGNIKGTKVVCPWHEWEFDIRSGKCVNVPGCDALTVPIKVIDGIIYLDEFYTETT